MILAPIVAGAITIATFFVGYKVGDSQDLDRSWSPKEHIQVMRECRKICGKDRVQGYDPIDLCSCRHNK